MYSNDITKITPPATMAELVTLDASREVPYLKARCNRIGIHVPGHNPTPAAIIPQLQTRLDTHIAVGPRALSDCSADYFEWKFIKEDLEEFIAYLKKLNAPVSTPFPPVQNADNSDPKTSRPSFSSVKPPNAGFDDAETHAGQHRDKTGPHAGQAGDNARTDPGQKRDKPVQPPGNSQKSPENPQIPNSQNPNSRGTTGTNNNDPTQPPKLDPDPNSVDINAYLNAYFEKHGPPSRERLDKKSPELQRYILTLIEDTSLRKAQHKLMLPPPYGPYIVTSKSALARLRNRHHTREAKRNKRSIKKHVADILAQPGLPDADVTRVTEQLLKLKLVELTLHPEPDLAQTKTLVDLLEKIHAGKLAERKVALAESKNDGSKKHSTSSPSGEKFPFA